MHLKKQQKTGTFKKINHTWMQTYKPKQFREFIILDPQLFENATKFKTITHNVKQVCLFLIYRAVHLTPDFWTFTGNLHISVPLLSL